MLHQILEQRRKPRIPLIPVVPSSDGVGFISKMPLGEQRREFPVRRQQAFLLSAGQKKIRSSFRIRCTDEYKRIVVPPRLAAGGSEDRGEATRLLKPLDGKRPLGNVHGRTESSHESEQVRMAQ